MNYTVDEIENLSDEEITKANRRLMAKIVTMKIVIPIVAVAVAHVGVNLLIKRINKNGTEN